MSGKRFELYRRQQRRLAFAEAVVVVNSIFSALGGCLWDRKCISFKGDCGLGGFKRSELRTMRDIIRNYSVNS